MKDDLTYDERNPAIGLMDNGRIGLVYKTYTPNPAGGLGQAIAMLFTYSDDRGATWSVSDTIKSANGSRMEPFGRILKFGDGRYHMIAYKDTFSFYSNYWEVYQTANNGALWTRQAIIDSTANVAGKTRWEPMMVYIGNNRVILTARNNASDVPDMTYPLRWISSNNGDTWTYQGETNLNGHLPRSSSRAPVYHLWDSTQNLVYTISSTRAWLNSTMFDSLYVYADHPDSIWAAPTKHRLVGSIPRPYPNNLYLYAYPDLIKTNDSSYLCLFTDKWSDKVMKRNTTNWEHNVIWQFWITRRTDISSIDKLYHSRYSSTRFIRNPITGLFDAKYIPPSVISYPDSTKRIAADGGLVLETSGLTDSDTLLRVKSSRLYNDVLKLWLDGARIEGNLTLTNRAGASNFGVLNANSIMISGEARTTGGNFNVRKDGSNSISGTYLLQNSAGNFGANWQLTGDATPGLAAWVHSGVSYTERLRILANGNVGVGSTAPSARLDVTGTTGYIQLRLRTSYTPTSSADTNGNTGDVSWDDSYIYIKTSAGWKRTTLSIF